MKILDNYFYSDENSKTLDFVTRGKLKEYKEKTINCFFFNTEKDKIKDRVELNLAEVSVLFQLDSVYSQKISKSIIYNTNFRNAFQNNGLKMNHIKNMSDRYYNQGSSFATLGSGVNLGENSLFNELIITYHNVSLSQTIIGFIF